METTTAQHILPPPSRAGNGSGGHRYRLASRENHPDNTIVRVGPHPIGAPHFQVIAGPCAVEDWNQLHRTVSALAVSGVRLIRAGAFKPRTSPYDFQGLGEEALILLEQVKREYDVKIVTEVVSERCLAQVARVADLLQIGSRNAQNYDLLHAVARAGRPVLLKRGMASTLDEWLCAAEHLMANGCKDVILCERGIKTFEASTRNTLDLGGVIVAKERTHLPVIVDPSHAAGRRDLVVPLALAAVAAGADGLIIEVHHDPASALCDAAQQLPAESFPGVLAQIHAMAKLMGRNV